MTANHLTLNLKKCKYMVFGTNHTLQDVNDINIRVAADGVAVDLADEFKYLGVHLDPKLTFLRHMEHVTKKCNSRLRMLGKTRKFVTEQTSLMMYKSLIAPVFYYCDVVYDCLSTADSSKLQKIQNSALRIVLQRDKCSHVAALHQDLNLMYLLSDRARRVASIFADHSAE